MCSNTLRNWTTFKACFDYQKINWCSILVHQIFLCYYAPKNCAIFSPKFFKCDGVLQMLPMCFLCHGTHAGNFWYYSSWLPENLSTIGLVIWVKAVNKLKKKFQWFHKWATKKGKKWTINFLCQVMQGQMIRFSFTSNDSHQAANTNEFQPCRELRGPTGKPY